jgi:purine nucleosidase
MSCRTLTFLALLFPLVMLGAATVEATPPVKLIFDTDIESDVDDVGTVALLHALADRGEVELLAMGVSAKHEWCVPCLDALNTYYGRPDIPIGVVKGPGVRKNSRYAQKIAEEFPHDLKSADDAPDAALLYRRVLAGQPERSVVIVTVGFLTNVANLLKTGPDAHSPLDGKELVAKKVRAWVCMGGKFPQGREWNVHRDAAASKYAIENFPRPIVFSGYEIGRRVKTGAKLRQTPKDNPVRRAYELYNGLNDRESWDQTAALYAVRGLDGGLTDLWDIETTGTCHVEPDGTTQWRDSPDKDHSYLVEKKPPGEVAAAIEALMVAPPR